MPPCLVTTFTTAPWTLPYSTDAPTDWTCTSCMKSTPGSALAAPFEGDVKSVPSIRKLFSFVLEPNAEIVLMVPLDGDVGEIPGAASDQVEHSGSSSWDRGEILGRRSESPHPGSVRPCARTCPRLRRTDVMPASCRTTAMSVVVLTPMRTS